jgi:hypothetical protein
VSTISAMAYSDKRIRDLDEGYFASVRTNGLIGCHSSAVVAAGVAVVAAAAAAVAAVGVVEGTVTFAEGGAE